MIFQRLNETLYFFWHHLTDLLWRLSPLLPLLVLANYRQYYLHAGDPVKVVGDPTFLITQAVAGVLALGLSVRFTLAVARGDGGTGAAPLWAAALDRSLALAAAQILAGILITAGLLLFILPGLYLMGMLLPALVIVMAEDVPATVALRAAWTRFRHLWGGVTLGVLLLLPAILCVLAGLDALGQLLVNAPLALRVGAGSLLDLIGLLFAQPVGILLVRHYELERRGAAEAGH